eukprot:TRINITY_DN9627_c1_g1_i2.p1 TRINITY_DN9627_c1_g1~~TRINITY_DN9627_c1_g1_i2.p1  ORF type:complete len:703 (+),score=285.50 TRINITY_DN9627_c1_g1_i2:108-2216(+)
MADFPVLSDGELAALVDNDVLSESGCDALLGDVDLQQYSTDSAANLAAAEGAVIDETVKGESDIHTLHVALDACASVLQDVEKSLGGFYTDIDKVTGTINAMQGEMGAIQKRLENRRAVEKHLSELLANALVPPAIVDELANSDVSDTFIGHIDKVSRSSKEVGKHPNSAIAAEVAPCLQSLTLQLAAKVRGYLLAKVALLNRPKTNVTIIQQSVLTKYRPLMKFLMDSAPEAGQDVKDSYVATLSSLYYTKTKGFLETLTKLEKKMLSKSDVVTAVKKTDPPNDPGMHYSFRGRTNLLEHWNAPIVVPYIDKEKGRTHTYENLFRSMHLMLLDIITSEYIFTYTFFSDKNLYIPIFQKVITLCGGSVGTALPHLHDHLTLASCVRLTLQFKAIMAKRAIPCLDGYLDSVLMKLWGQLDAVLRANVAAIAAFTAHPVRLPAPAVFPLTSKFAEFTGVLYSLFAKDEEAIGGGSGNEARVAVLHGQLHTMAAELHRILHLKAGASASDQHLFVVLNLQHVLDVWGRLRIHPDSHEETQMLTSWVLKAKASLIDGLVDAAFPSMVAVISAAESAIRDAAASAAAPAAAAAQPDAGDAAGGVIRPSTSRHDQYRGAINQKAVLQTAEDFGRHWVVRIKDACGQVTRRTPQATGAELVTRLVMQVAIYNERMKKVLSTCWLNPPCRNLLVPNQAILDTVQEVAGKL